MKKILSILSLLTLVTLPAFAIDDPQFTNVMELRGRGAGQATSPRIIKLVRNAREGDFNTSFSSGDAVAYSLVSDDGVTVDYTTTSGDATFAGICATTINSSDASTGTTAADDVGRRNWGWIIVHGSAIANIRAGGTNNNNAGDFFITSGDASVITTPISFDSGANIAYGLNQIKRVTTGKGGFFYDAAGTGPTTTSVEVFVEAV